MTRKEKIFNFIQDKNYKPMSFKDMAVLLSVPKEDKERFLNILSELEAEGKIFRNSKNRYEALDISGLLKGVFSSNGKSYGFVITDDGEKFFVNPHDTSGAFNKDVVLIKKTSSRHYNQKCTEGKIIKIISHGMQNVVGTYEAKKNFAFVVPDSKSFANDIYISKKHCVPDADGKKVLVKITKWPDGSKKAKGVIEKVLGFENEKDVDIKCILSEFGLEEEFPKKVILSALSFGDRVYEEELEGREDFRDHLIFTIDGDDARDFDDAVEIEKTKSGYQLGVHIADVSYYVAENSALDIEARKRGTSVYLPSFVVPMLPKHLSNGLCSLNPHCDRLTLSVIINFDNYANITDYRIAESVINSKYRMTYKKVLDIINGDEKTRKEYQEIVKPILIMNELKNKLKSKRLKNGSIDFYFPEVKLVLDENGKPTDVYKEYPDDAHSLIEEFMLCANVCVAKEMFFENLPAIYRIHEKPSPDKMDDFSRLVSHFGYSINTRNDNPQPIAFADLLRQIEGSKNELLLSKLMLRSLMKAKYSETCIGHFGLGFEHYCHFTSPIRRYPDLVVHRILKEHIKYKLSENRKRFLTSFVQKSAKSSSNAELNAMEAEREAADIKKAEFMSDKIGNVYDAVVSSITSFGIFAETEFGIEGLISMVDLDDDYYEYDETTLRLVGKHSRKIYSIGDEIKIRVKRADVKYREIDFYIESGDTK